MCSQSTNRLQRSTDIYADKTTTYRRIQELQDQLILVFDWGEERSISRSASSLARRLLRLSTSATRMSAATDSTSGSANLVRERHAESSRAHPLKVEPNAEKALIQQCEATKIDLSSRPSSTVFVQNFIRTDKPERTLEVVVSREDLERMSADLVDAGIAAGHQILDRVSRRPEAIALCLATGGMVQMPRIRERLLEIFGPLRVPQIERGDQLIAEGAAWVAHDRARLRLAKPVEAAYMRTRATSPSYHRTLSCRSRTRCGAGRSASTALIPETGMRSSISSGRSGRTDSSQAISACLTPISSSALTTWRRHSASD